MSLPRQKTWQIPPPRGVQLPELGYGSLQARIGQLGGGWPGNLAAAIREAPVGPSSPCWWGGARATAPSAGVCGRVHESWERGVQAPDTGRFFGWRGVKIGEMGTLSASAEYPTRTRQVLFHVNGQKEPTLAILRTKAFGAGAEAAAAAETRKRKAPGLAVKAVETQAKGSVVTVKAVETQDKGSVVTGQMAVETQDKGRVFVTVKAVETQGKGRAIPAR